MPYRRSRLQDYYDQLLGNDPPNDDPPAEPEPGDSHGWLPSYIDPPVLPESRPEDAPGNGGNGLSKVDETWLPPYIPDHSSQTEQSTGQASSSKSDKQGSTGASQSEARPDADRGKHETRAQDELLDFEDGQEDNYFPGLVAGLGPNRQLKYSSLDVIRVKQLLEARPFTIDRIIATSDSFETACGHLFAFPEDVGGVGVIWQAWCLFQGGGGGSEGSSGDERNDVQETFSLDDVRQFTEIDLANAALDEGEELRYELMLEKVFEFDIEWGNNDENKLHQLQNLAKANVHIVDYLDHVIEKKKQNQDLEITGLSIFQRNISQTDTGPLQVWLGADSVLVEVFDLEGKGAKDAKYLGNVPLKASASGEELKKVYLGSEVNIATITHEFMHVLDRNTGITRDILKYWTDDTDVSLDLQIFQYVIKGFAAKQTAHDEVWADIGMTAVLDLAAIDLGAPYKVFSVKDTYDDNTGRWLYLEKLTVGDVFDCRNDSCEFRDVGWKDTGNADDVKAYMIDLFWEKLVLQNGETADG